MIEVCRCAQNTLLNEACEPSSSNLRWKSWNTPTCEKSPKIKMFRKTSLRLCEYEWRKWWLEIYKKQNDAKCVFLFLIGAARVRAPRALQQSQSEPAETCPRGENSQWKVAPKIHTSPCKYQECFERASQCETRIRRWPIKSDSISWTCVDLWLNNKLKNDDFNFESNKNNKF